MSEGKVRQVTLALEYPLDRPDGSVLAEITIRRPKAGDMVAIEAARNESEAAQGFAMLSILTGLPAEVIEELDLEDFTNASEKIGDFFPQARALISGEA